MDASITGRLLTHTPSLLPEAEWPMSKGKWMSGGQIGKPSHYVYDGNGDLIANCYRPLSDYEAANARYIAACSPDELVSELWEEYQEHIAASEYVKHNYTKTSYELCMKRALRLLARLDKMGAIKWEEKQ